MKKLFQAVLLLCALFPSVCYAGPFGLDAGMSRDEVVQRIGKGAIVKEYADSISFNTVPLRSIYFSHYDCYFDQNNKLWSIDAYSDLLGTKSNGEDLRDSFDTLKSALEDKYGKVLYVTGSKTSGVQWLDSNGFGKIFNEAVWDGSGGQSRSFHISAINLKLNSRDKDHGFIDLRYQFNTVIEGSL